MSSVTLISKPAGWAPTQGDFNADLKKLIQLHQWPKNYMQLEKEKEDRPKPSKVLSESLKDIQTLLSEMQAATQVDPGLKDPYPG